MGKLAVKYLDPETGEYKYATVVDVGDLTKLKTTVKSDLVSAINSIEITGELPADVQNQLDEINQNINDIQSGVLTETQVAGINQKITEGISNLVTEVNQLNTKINDDIVKAKNELLGDVDQKLENVENDYNSKIGVISGSLDGAKADIDSVESDLINVGTKLQTVETNYTKVSSDIDIINGELSTKVNSSDFNLMESKVSQNTTEIEQTKEDISLLATKSSLDLVTDRVTKAESDIKINADGLSSRVTYTELNEQLDNASKYGDNILRGTRNWDNWETNNIAKAYISNDTYRHCKIQVIEDKQYYYETELDGLDIGKTYIASIYFKTKVESDSASVNINIGSESIPLDNLVEDTLILNGWKRVSANFVASDVKTNVSFRFSFLDTNNIGYLVASKIETGIKPSEWKPHFDDDNETIIKNETLIKQNSDSIVSLVSSTEKLGEDIETANTQITQTAESLSLQAQKITDIEGEVSENKASIVLANNKIETKVSQTDVDKSISDIDLDTKNRIINSDFSRGFSNWNEINSGFTIKEISGVNYAHIDRSGLINVSIASMASDKFPTKNGDKLVFSLDFMTESISSLDDETIMAIELFDINDTRVFSKTFNVADFNVSIVDNVITRVSSKYIIDREDVAKARLKIQLNKNGSVNFSKISLQKGDLKEKEWFLAPEDVQLLNVDLQTSIKQNADNIELRATKTELDTLTGQVSTAEGSISTMAGQIKLKANQADVNKITDKVNAVESSITVQSGQITALNTKTDGQTTQIGSLQSSYSGLTSTVSSVQNDLNNLTVGGENLLIDTDIGDLTKVNAPESRYFSDASNAFVTEIGFKQVSDSPTPSGYVVEATSIGGGGSGGRRIAFYSGSGYPPFVKGETYTMSCYARKISGNPKIPFQYGKGTNGYKKSDVDVDSTNWKQYSWTFVYAFDNPSIAYLGGISALTAGTLQSCGFKVERGNKATSWGLSQYELATVTELSQLSQDLSGFKTTVANTYADKVSVASQISQSATAVTSNVQSWTNNRLTSYSTTQQTTDSITNAVASKADKSQVTQLSNQITSTVTGITNESLFSTQMISSTTLKHPNYPVMPMVEVPVTNGESYTVSSNRPNDGTAAAPTAHVWYLRLPSTAPNSSVHGVYDGKSITLPALSDKIYIVFRTQSIADKFISGEYWLKVTKTPASQSQITQLSTDINLRVSKGDVTSQINVEAGRTLIDTKQLLLNANTVKFSGSAFIPNAVIQDISADKIKVGTLNAANVNVINLNAANITTGTLTGVNLSMNLNTGAVQFTKGFIAGNNSKIRFDLDRNYFQSLDGNNNGFIVADGNFTFYQNFLGTTKKRIGGLLGDIIAENGGVVLQGEGGATLSSAMYSARIDVGSAGIGTGNDVNIIGNTYLWNDFGVMGKKNAVHVTRDGIRATPAYETAESYLGDIGGNYTREDCEVWVDIEKLFSDTVNTDIAYHVFLQAYDDAHFWVAELKPDKFLIKSDKPMARFAWELKAKRRGYENDRLVVQEGFDNKMLLDAQSKGIFKGDDENE